MYKKVPLEEPKQKYILHVPAPHSMFIFHTTMMYHSTTHTLQPILFTMKTLDFFLFVLYNVDFVQHYKYIMCIEYL